MTGRVRRVNGPLVQAEGLTGVAVADLLELGRDRLPAEVVSVRERLVTAQAYEYTGGLAPGDPAHALHRPLAARLGPGLLGGVFDGLLRPLTGAGTWLSPQANRTREEPLWHFTPEARPGHVLGTVSGAGSVPHKVLAPPGLIGVPESVAPEGFYPADHPIATVGGQAVTLAQWWPVRRPRPFARRLDTGAPLPP